MADCAIHHPLMGVVQGKPAGTGSSVQFLGIKYGKLSNRFARAEVNEYTPSSGVDATKLGYGLVL